MTTAAETLAAVREGDTITVTARFGRGKPVTKTVAVRDVLVGRAGRTFVCFGARGGKFVFAEGEVVGIVRHTGKDLDQGLDNGSTGVYIDGVTENQTKEGK